MGKKAAAPPPAAAAVAPPPPPPAPAAPETKKKAAELKAPAVEEISRSIIRRVVKDKLSHISSHRRSTASAAGDDEEGVVVHKDAMIAFSEAARVFIHYLSAAANDVCSEANRKLMNAEDVLKALEDIDFPEFVQPLKADLAEFRLKNDVKKSKKRKVNEGGKDEGLDAGEVKDQVQKLTTATNSFLLISTYTPYLAE